MPEMPMEENKVESYTAGIPQEGQEVDPKFQQKVEGYTTVVMTLLHSEKTRSKVDDMVKSSNDPYVAVPQAAMAVNDMAVNMMEQSGKQVDPGVQIAASPLLIGDLIELGIAAKQWERPNEQEIEGITEDTLQMAIERGLKDGSIDPIQLQLEIEPFMNEQQRNLGNAIGEKEGMGKEPNQQAMIDQYANRKVRDHEARAAKKQALQKQATALQGGGPQNG